MREKTNKKSDENLFGKEEKVEKRENFSVIRSVECSLPKDAA